MTEPFLPYGKQSISAGDIKAVSQALEAPLLTTGPLIEQFETAFAQMTGAKHAVVCANGTAALHIAAIALGLGKDDVVLAPSMSFVASANGPGFTGAKIAFMDCDPDTGLVTPEIFQASIKREGTVSAAVLVHLNGEVADMAAIRAIANANGVRLIEDACHAIGTVFDLNGQGDPAYVGDCRYSELACFSLHPVKTITMGEGGVVTTNSDDLARRMRLARSHGINRDPELFSNTEMALDPATGQANPWYYEMAAPGFNYRATDFACALGLSQLGQLDGFIARRKILKDRYDAHFHGFNGPVKPVDTKASCDPCRHLYPVLFDFAKIGLTRAEVARRLYENGIGTQVHYIPIHRQPYYRSLDPQLSLEGADRYYERVLSLPLFPMMADTDPERVFDAVKTAIAA